MLADLRFALRSLRHRPLFTLAAVVTIALGIGATTAIFSVLDAVVLRPLAYDDSKHIVEVLRANTTTGTRDDQLSYPNFRDLRDRQHSLSQIAAFRYWLFTLGAQDYPESLLGIHAGDGLFDVLRVRPAAGRFFTSGSESRAYPREAILSYELWQRRFAGRATVIDSAITIDGVPTVVVGVLPRGFRFPNLVPASAPLPSRNPDLYLPMGSMGADDLESRGSTNYWAIGRMAPGATAATVNADIALVGTGLATDYPAYNADRALTTVPLKEHVLGDAVRPVALLFGAVTLVLLIACANVGGLLVARAAERQGEIGIRTALGASPIRLARQMVTESLLLAMLGGGGGIALANWGIATLRRTAPNNIPRIDEISMDGRVLGFALAATIVSGILFGLVPLMRRPAPGLALKSGTRTTLDRSSRRLRSTLVVAEVALAVVLLAGAGLLLRSFGQLSSVDPGFDGHGVMTMFTLLPEARYADPAAIDRFERRVLDELDALPDVESAAAINTLPLSNLGNNTGVQVIGKPAPAVGAPPSIAYRILAGPYFETMRMRIVAGRDFGPVDTHDAPPVAIINEAAARRFFPGEDAIGKQLRLTNADPRPKTIVGIVADVHGVALDSGATPEVSYPSTQGAEPIVSLAIRTRGDPYAALPSIRDVLARVDPGQAFFAERTMEDLLGSSLATRRFNLELLAAFALAALVLAAVGLYGVIAFSVSHRAPEIGIRTTLGATRSSIISMVLREGAVLGGLGLAVGVGGALAAGRILQAWLYNVGAADPVTLLGVTTLLAAVVLTASYIPALRAARVDPMRTLRGE